MFRQKIPCAWICTFVLAALFAGGRLAAADPKPAFAPPYADRTNPFQRPDSKAVQASRREAAVQQVDLKLRGFVNRGTPRAVVEIDGQIAALAPGEKRGDIQVLEIAPPALTLQRGRHRWTETLHEAHGKVTERSP